jgi:excisionase family DNA binding protein
VSENLAYRFAEAAPKVGLGMTKFRQEVAAGRIEAVRAGRVMLVPHDALVAYIDLLRSETEASRVRAGIGIVREVAE